MVKGSVGILSPQHTSFISRWNNLFTNLLGYPTNHDKSRLQEGDCKNYIIPSWLWNSFIPLERRLVKGKKSKVAQIVQQAHKYPTKVQDAKVRYLGNHRSKDFPYFYVFFGHFHGATSGKNCHPFRGVQTPLLWRRDVLEFIAHALHAEALTLHLTHREEVRNDTILPSFRVVRRKFTAIWPHWPLHLWDDSPIHHVLLALHWCCVIVFVFSLLWPATHQQFTWPWKVFEIRAKGKELETAKRHGVYRDIAGMCWVPPCLPKDFNVQQLQLLLHRKQLSDISHHGPSCEPYDLDGLFEIPKIKNQPPGMMYKTSVNNGRLKNYLSLHWFSLISDFFFDGSHLGPRNLLWVRPAEKIAGKGQAVGHWATPSVVVFFSVKYTWNARKAPAKWRRQRWRT